MPLRVRSVTRCSKPPWSPQCHERPISSPSPPVAGRGRHAPRAKLSPSGTPRRAGRPHETVARRLRRESRLVCPGPLGRTHHKWGGRLSRPVGGDRQGHKWEWEVCSKTGSELDNRCPLVTAGNRHSQFSRGLAAAWEVRSQPQSLCRDRRRSRAFVARYCARYRTRACRQDGGPR